MRTFLRLAALVAVLSSLVSVTPVARAGSDLPAAAGAGATANAQAPLPATVIVKFRDDAAVRIRGGRLVSLAGADLAGVEATLDLFGRPGLARLFTPDESVLDTLRRRGMRRTGRALADLNGYVEFALDATRHEAFIRALEDHDAVQVAYPAPRPAPPPADIPPTTPDYEPSQGYLTPAPDGIDANVAWTHAGGRGEGIYVVDIEYDWNDNHEDLNAALGGKACYTPNGNFIDHGTAVLGELGGGQNGYGVTGIVPLATLGMVTQDPVGMTNSVARAINCATTIMSPGDVMLLETQAFGPGGDYVPSEWNQAEFDATATATANGIVVVAAAGNGNQDLDDPVFNGLFDRSVRDSGAIIVGAGASPGATQPDRSRLSFSTYGSRIDVQGWGHNVMTTGYGSLFSGGGDPNQYYTATFNGTSSASPVVAGAAAALQGIQKARGGPPLDPLVVRQILTDTGTPQQEGPFPGPIGPRPNLAAAIASLADLVLESVTIDDAAPYGNANAILEPGETATVRLSVTNAGGQLSTGTAGSILSNHGNLQITDGSADWPDIASSSTAESLPPHFRLTAGPQIACGEEIPVSLLLTSDQYSEQASFGLVLGRTAAAYVSTDGVLTIPKTSQNGVTSTASATDSFTIENVQVTLDVSHQDIGQLRIDLQSPTGTIVTLHDHSGAGVIDLATTYDSQTSPDGPGTMNDFDGEPVTGSWTLTVIDDVGGPEPAGTLNGWSLDFVATAAFDCTPLACGEPLPAPVGNSVVVAAFPPDDIALSWGSVAGVSGYRVWRSTSPQMTGAVLVGQTGATSLVENGGLTDPAPIVFYDVRSVNACEWEEP